MFIKKAVLPLKSSKKNFDLKNFSEYDLSDDGVAAFGWRQRTADSLQQVTEH